MGSRFIPKDMDGKTKPSEMYTAEDNIIALDEENAENSNEGLNDTQDQGEHGVAAELINIGTTKELATIRFNDDVHKQPLRYYVEKIINHVILEDIGIKTDMDCIANLGEHADVSKR